MKNNTGLLIIDVQVGLFTDTEPVYEGERLLNSINTLAAKARAAGLPVIYVQHDGGEGDPLKAGTEGFQIHPAIAPRPHEPIVVKTAPDSFHETNLQKVLEAQDIQKLIVMGMQTEVCVEATCRRARNLGYDVTLVKDGHSTYNTPKAGAAQIIAETNAGLAEVNVRLKPLVEVANDPVFTPF